VKEFSLPVRTLTFWRIRLTVAAAPIIAVILCLRPKVIFIAAAGLLAAAFLFLSFIYLPKYHINYKIVLGEGVLIVFCGVFIKTEKILPLNRTVISRRIETPLYRLCGLSRLSFSAVRKSCCLAPMCSEDCEQILYYMGGQND
jgi:membrane protein YdbS with pleckstrin-like domain